MKWSDIPRNPSRKTLRQFAGAWLVFFLCWAAWLGLKKGQTESGVTLAIVALLGGIGGWVRPSLLKWIFVGWMILAFPIGWLVSLIMLSILFYAVFTPIALLLRLRGRDALGLKRPPDRTSFWLRKETPLDVRSYFRQY
jgi:hypothetical protein